MDKTLQTIDCGLENMLHLERLPLLRDGVGVHYVGSIDKKGGNADWDWWLYQDQRGEWVIFDVEGPGCIYNFVQHRYPDSERPLFRFYFDGETEPRFTIKPEEFGKKHPFVEPLAAIFEGDDVPPQGRGPIWVMRSFVPMPFHKACRITSSVKLAGNSRLGGEGGWGHVMHHRYHEDPGIETFTGQEDYRALLDLWNASPDPTPVVPGENRIVENRSTLEPGSSAVLLHHAGAGAVAGLQLRLDQHADASKLWLRATWDDENAPAIDCPLSAFFGNEIGDHRIGWLTHGQLADGTYYCRFPMPFWTSARMELANRGGTSVQAESVVHVMEDTGSLYPRECTGTFRATPYHSPALVAPGHDTLIAEVTGRGHIVSATLSGHSHEGRHVSCEGDVRLYIDGNGTPHVQSDGSESYACYGWGFPAPPQQNPSSGYDGSAEPEMTFSETRVHTGDWMPYRTGFRFCFEAGGHNDCDMLHAGVVLYYGRPEPAMKLTDEVDVGNAPSEEAHSYRVEGQSWSGELESSYEDDVDTEITDCGRAHRGWSEFTVQVRGDNRGVRLRRRSDQQRGRQRARVFVDGQLVGERTWYWPDRNPHRRWLEDEFELPPVLTHGKQELRIRIECVQDNGTPPWTEFHYWVFSHTDGKGVL